MDVDDLLDLIQQRRGISRQEARERLATMPGGAELLAGAVPVDESLLAAELIADDPELGSFLRRAVSPVCPASG
jgi:hypothetical protein